MDSARVEEAFLGKRAVCAVANEWNIRPGPGPAYPRSMIGTVNFGAQDGTWMGG